ncbi:hypothetical protein Tco_0184904 [Tanacetum coccineum]
MIITIPHNLRNLVVTEFDSTEKFMNGIGGLRAISGHVLGASGVQIPQNNLENLQSIREEEDGATKVSNPQDEPGSIRLAVIDFSTLGKQEKERRTYRDYREYEESSVRIKCRSISKKKKSNYSSFQDLRSSCNEDIVKYEGPRPSTTQARALNKKSSKKIPPATSQPPGWRVSHPAGRIAARLLEPTFFISL